MYGNECCNILCRKIGLILAASMLFLLAGCGAKGKDKRSVERTGDGRILLTLDTMSGGYNEELKRIVEEYNGQSEDYFVELNDRSEGMEDLDEAEDLWRIELMLGKGGDILDMGGLDPKTLGTAGVLADLCSFQPKEQWQQECVSSVVRAMETDGALYAMGSQFNIYTVVANATLVDAQGGWTMQEMMDVFASHGKGVNALANLYPAEGPYGTGAGYTMELSGFVMDDYINWTEKTANFDTGEFYSFLEFAREREKTGGYETAYSTGIASGEYLAGLHIINSVADYQVLRRLYSDRLAVKGFPTARGNGVSIQMFDKMAIYAGSPCQAGAWDFLQYYLKNSTVDVAFPVRQDRLEGMLAASMEKEFVEDEETGEMQELFKRRYVDQDTAFEVYAAAQEDVDAVREIIGLVDRVRGRDQTVQKIICEEMAGWIDGDMPMEKVVENIDNRVRLYLQEQEPVKLKGDSGN